MQDFTNHISATELQVYVYTTKTQRSKHAELF